MAGRGWPLQESHQPHFSCTKHTCNGIAWNGSTATTGMCRDGEEGLGMGVGKAGTGGRKKAANEQQRRTQVKLDVG